MCEYTKEEQENEIKGIIEQIPLKIWKVCGSPSHGECEGLCGTGCDTVMYLTRNDPWWMFVCKECRDEFKEDWCKDTSNPTHLEWEEFVQARTEGDTV